jgi:glycoprotein endo-alpha-1,2-mannosidase
VLRRLLVVGLAWACFGVPSSARAGTVAIFYYPWYGTPAQDGTWQHWSQNKHRPPNDVYSRFYPARGPYASDDSAVLDQQMAEMAAAGIDEVVSSWWGRGSTEDARLSLVLAAARRHHLQPAIHLEPYPGRSPASVVLDIKYLASLGIRDIYVYHPRDFAASEWAAMRPQVPAGLRLFAGTQLVGFAAAGLFDGFYTYYFMKCGGGKFVRLCNQAHAVHLLCATSVGPGYDGVRAGEAVVLSAQSSRRNGMTYDNLWTAALAAKPDLVTITSYNEWGEGTQIEPAVAHPGYKNYDGAWGLVGPAAANAYMLRTAYWTGRFHAGP